MAKGLYKLFASDKQAEQAGILVNFGEVRLRVARAGGGNTKFRRLVQAKLKPYRHQIDTDTMDEKVTEKLVREAYAEAVVFGWESKVSGEGEPEAWEPWLETPRGKEEFSAEACAKVFDDLPELFKAVQQIAGSVASFRKIEEEEDAKN